MHDRPCGCAESVPVLGRQDALFPEPAHAHYYDRERSAWQCRECCASTEDCHNPPETEPTYEITLMVDEGWLRAIQQVTAHVEFDETCSWVSVEKN